MTIRERDPIMYVVQHCIKQSGLRWKTIADDARVSRGTIKSWMELKVRRPQAMTVRQVLGALGYQMIIRSYEGTETDIGPKRVKFAQVSRPIQRIKQ